VTSRGGMDAVFLLFDICPKTMSKTRNSTDCPSFLCSMPFRLLPDRSGGESTRKWRSPTCPRALRTAFGITTSSNPSLFYCATRVIFSNAALFFFVLTQVSSPAGGGIFQDQGREEPTSKGRPKARETSPKEKDPRRRLRPNWRTPQVEAVNYENLWSGRKGHGSSSPIWQPLPGKGNFFSSFFFLLFFPSITHHRLGLTDSGARVHRREDQKSYRGEEGGEQILCALLWMEVEVSLPFFFIINPEQNATGVFANFFFSFSFSSFFFSCKVTMSGFLRHWFTSRRMRMPKRVRKCGES